MSACRRRCSRAAVWLSWIRRTRSESSSICAWEIRRPRAVEDYCLIADQPAITAPMLASNSIVNAMMLRYRLELTDCTIVRSPLSTAPILARPPRLNSSRDMLQLIEGSFNCSGHARCSALAIADQLPVGWSLDLKSKLIASDMLVYEGLSCAFIGSIGSIGFGCAMLVNQPKISRSRYLLRFQPRPTLQYNSCYQRPPTCRARSSA